MEPAIFLEKVRFPDSRGLARERLERRLLDLDAPPIALILGPPGSGKTTLLSRVATAGRIPSAWYRVGAEDDREQTLVSHLGYGLSTALGDRRLAAAETVDTLVTALDHGDASACLLVIDDVHTVAGTPAESALDRFLELRPRKVRVLLGSRRPPLINTSRLLANGELCQLEGEDLRFRSWEVEELFRVLYGQPLSPESAAALTRRTSGWAAGLHLFQLATAAMSRPERERAVAELTGRSRLIRSYLTRNVLDGLDDRRRQFLLRTSTLGVLTGDLCDQLVGEPGSAIVLDELERLQFFTTSTDGGLTFRYHQVLQTHLEVVLVDEIGRRAATQLYARAAQVLEGEQRIAPAVRAYARAEDWGSVARLLHHGSPSLPTDDDWLWNVLGPPGAPADDPALVVAGARRLLRNGLVGEAVAAYRHAQSLMDDPEFHARCAQERTVAAFWTPAASGLDSGLRAKDRTVRLMAELRQCTRSVDNPDAFTLPLSRGIARLLAGDAYDAARLLSAALRDRDAAEWERVAARLATQLVTALRDPTGGAGEEVEEAVLSADVAGLPWLSRMGRGVRSALSLASRVRTWELDACEDLLSDAEQHGDLWSLCLINGLVGLAHAQTGKQKAAVATLQRAAEAASELGAPVLQVWSRCLRRTVTGEPPLSRRERESLSAWARSVGVVGAARLVEMPGLPPPVSAVAAPSAPAHPRAESSIVLNSLGSFDLIVDGAPVDLGTVRPKARTLLWVLALHHGQPVHREVLIEAVWPESGTISGTRSLQVAVSSLRQRLLAAGLAEPCLRRQGDGYLLCLPQAIDQRREFEQLVAEGRRLEAAGDRPTSLAVRLRALDAYAGDLLPEAGPAEWVVAERDRLRLLAATAGREAARVAATPGELASGIGAARRSAEIDPYSDTTWQLIADLLEQSGDHTAATLARREHARLQAELGPVQLVRRHGRPRRDRQ